MLFIYIALGVFIFLMFWSVLEQNFIGITHYHIETQKTVSNAFQSSFVVLSDLHNRRFGKKNERLLKKIDFFKPDAILIPGDIITKHKPCLPSNGYSLLKELVKKYPVYYAYGNHEQYFELLKNKEASQAGNKENEKLYTSWLRYKEELKKLGVILLNNESTSFSKNPNIRITGITIDEKYFSRYKKTVMPKDEIKACVGISREESYQILLAHNPIYFKEYVDWGADLILSGHLHGGLVRLPFLGGLVSPQVTLFPKYDSGKFTNQNRDMIVSRGLGSHSGMPRLFNRPELIHITIRKE